MRQRIANLLRAWADWLEPNETARFADWYAEYYLGPTVADFSKGIITVTGNYRPRPR